MLFVSCSYLKSVTTICKNWKSVRWYDGIVWNSATITQILLGDCTLNFVQYGACLHLSVQNVCGADFFLDTRYIIIAIIIGIVSVIVFWPRYSILREWEKITLCNTKKVQKSRWNEPCREICSVWHVCIVCISFMCLRMHVDLIQPLATRNNKRYLFVTLLLFLL